MNAAIVDPGFIIRVRKKLALDQQEAAAIFGGGVNAFSRYENGNPPLWHWLNCSRYWIAILIYCLSQLKTCLQAAHNFLLSKADAQEIFAQQKYIIEKNQAAVCDEA